MFRALLFLVVVPWTAAAAHSSPRLMFRESASLGTVTSIRLVAPDGRTTWRCDTAALRHGTSARLECIAPPYWYVGPGHYIAVVRNTGSKTTRINEVAFDVTGEESLIVIGSSPHSARMEMPPRPPPAGVVLLVATDRALEGELRNGSKQSIFGSFQNSPPAIRIDILEDGKWRSTDIDHADTSHAEEIAPGTSARFHFPLRARSLLEPGTYRIAGRFTLTAPNNSKPPADYEVVSEPFEWRPGTVARACEAPFWNRREAPESKGTYPEFRKIFLWHGAAFVLKGNGEVLHADATEPTVVTTLPERADIQKAPDGTLLLRDGERLFTLRDFESAPAPRPGPPLDERASVTFAGARLFEYGLDGDLAWRTRDGERTPIQPPIRASWTTASFRDAQQGAVLGDCSVLLETSDGGESWRVTPAPWPYQSQLVWRGEDLWLFGSRGAFRRRPGAAFERVISSGRCHAVPTGELLVVHCGSAVLVSRAGGALEGVVNTTSIAGINWLTAARPDGSFYVVSLWPTQVVRWSSERGFEQLLRGARYDEELAQANRWRR